MEYKVVNSVSTDYGRAISKLEEEVKELLIAGWKIQGGISISTHMGNLGTSIIVLAQAMIKD